MTARNESLTDLLGGRRAALDSVAPVIGFAAGWLAGGQSIALGAGIAVLTGAIIAAWRLRQGRAPAATVISLLLVCLGAIVALRTGRAEDFFLVRLLTNAASALAWTGSILVRWPLLGLIAGTVLGQKTRWRRDPGLLRGYQTASWVWVAQYLLRLLVFVPLWWAGQVVWLATAQVALTWPLVAGCLAASWWVFRRVLPPDHPGIRHPRPAAATPSGGLEDDQGLVDRVGQGEDPV